MSAQTRSEENLLPLTVEYAPPLGDDDQGGYRINAPGVEQLAFVWLRNRYVMPADPRGAASGEQFGSNDAERYARCFAAAPDLLALAKQCAEECAECGGTGWREVPIDDDTLEDQPCDDCAHIRKVIAKAEGSK